MMATNHDDHLGGNYPTMLNELNCTFGAGFSRFHCCGCHGHGLWPSWFVAIVVCGRRGLWPEWFVAGMVCGHRDIVPLYGSKHTATVLSVRLKTSLAQYLVKNIRQIFTKLTALMHSGTEMNISDWGEKVKVQGHGGITCSGNSALHVVETAFYT